MTANEWWKFMKCPKCFSENVSMTLRGSIRQDDPDANDYHCKDCDSRGAIGELPSPVLLQGDIT